ncbi:hypothetical protein BJ508DRAFT_416587 [Ascobolus immersus RN42]|uniref:Uncharacterized protein n=1 Tax=Ascobolus immersus RN42 TaxID=1160509 RepID=A0A3N4HX57_ASCIM|nr:hypothetical protein BJ508DRAFT_416587 [Ascobolus immersus RN42]
MVPRPPYHRFIPVQPGYFPSIEEKRTGRCGSCEVCFKPFSTEFARKFDCAISACGNTICGFCVDEMERKRETDPYKCIENLDAFF